MGRLRNGVGVGVTNIPTLSSRPPFLRAFSPLSLFAGGTQGVWFDDSDMTTMFQDSAGTTPVTAVEQPVGRQLDLSGNNNHRTQATSANRPTLSARYTLITKSEDFSGWLSNFTTVSTNTTLSPIGTLTADTLAGIAGGASVSLNSIPIVSGVTNYTASICILKTVGAITFPMIALNLTGGTTVFGQVILNTNTGALSVRSGLPGATNLSVTDYNGYWLVSYQTQSNAGNTVFSILVYPAASSDGTTFSGILIGSVVAWGADVRPTNQATGLIPTYQRIDTSSVYDTVGFPQYLRYNGSNSSLSTASVNFTATAQMSVFSGIRKLSDAGITVFIELSQSLNTNNGTFNIFAPGNTASPNFSFNAKGSSGIQVTAPSNYAAPITNTINLLISIPTPSILANVNAISVGSSSASLGTGNFGNYPLYFGARGGASIFFNGQEYQTIIVGRTLTATEITNTETYVNSKTKAYA